MLLLQFFLACCALNTALIIITTTFKISYKASLYALQFMGLSVLVFVVADPVQSIIVVPISIVILFHWMMPPIGTLMIKSVAKPKAKTRKWNFKAAFTMPRLQAWAEVGYSLAMLGVVAFWIWASFPITRKANTSPRYLQRPVNSTTIVTAQYKRLARERNTISYKILKAMIPKVKHMLNAPKPSMASIFILGVVTLSLYMVRSYGLVSCWRLVKQTRTCIGRLIYMVKGLSRKLLTIVTVDTNQGLAISRENAKPLDHDVFTDIIKANNSAPLQPEDLLDSEIEVVSTTDSGIDTSSTTTQLDGVPMFDPRSATTAEPSCLPDLQTTSPTAKNSCQNASSPGSASTSSSSLKSRARRSPSPSLEVDQWQVEVADCATMLFHSATSMIKPCGKIATRTLSTLVDPFVNNRYDKPRDARRMKRDLTQELIKRLRVYRTNGATTIRVPLDVGYQTPPDGSSRTGTPTSDTSSSSYLGSRSSSPLDVASSMLIVENWPNGTPSTHSSSNDIRPTTID
ncbi:hypothetical protein BDN72DRAFT_901982 [Pluteus cervinus]|uniref:Uncharacterized protein n=1 Tax=Pluteus cervinus TaxID=181527 RepID=A0ACD3AE89_9AGAR|nr:hypothetical protein BDN72DRAFT_901982 [Pluteus cervinus]